MEKIDKILQNATQIKINQELLSEEEIRRIVDNIPDSNSKIVKLIRKIIIMTVPIFIVFLSLYLAGPDNPESGQEQINPQNPSNQIVNSFEENEQKPESTDIKFNNLNNRIDSVNENKTEPKKITVEFKEVPDKAKRDNKPLESLPWKIEGMTILELSDEEFEKLVPNSRKDDTCFYIYQEKLIDKDNFDKTKLSERGFKLNDLPLILLVSSEFSPNMWKFSKGSSKIYSTDKYMKTLYIAYSTTDHIFGKGHAMYNTNSSLILDNSKDSLMRYYSDFHRTVNMKMYNAKFINHDTVEHDRLYYEGRILDLKLFENLVPVRIKIYPGTNFIFWFYPNKEFLAAIPERYSANLRKELEIKKLLESGVLDITEACKGLNSEASIFGFCQMSNGAIKFDNLFPNPDRELTKLSFTLTDNRKLNISIYNLNGKIIEELVNNKSYETGSYEIDILMDKLSVGINYLIIKTDFNETIVKRILKF